MGTGNSATSNTIKLVHWPLMGGLLHLVQRGGDWAGCKKFQMTHQHVMRRDDDGGMMTSSNVRPSNP